MNEYCFNEKISPKELKSVKINERSKVKEKMSPLEMATLVKFVNLLFGILEPGDF